jgi:putative ABC transport system permease protein
MAAFADRFPPAVRGLLRQKRFAALAIVSLGVAMALNTTMYSVLDALIFPKVEMSKPEQLFSLSFYGDYKGRVPQQHKLEAIQATRMYGGMARRAPTFGNNVIERGTRMRPAIMVNVSPDYFALLGNRPSEGRLLSDADLSVEPRSVVVSRRLWKQLFPDSAWFASAKVVIDGEPRIVVGVLEAHSDFPGSRTDVWQLPGANDRAFPSTIYNVVRLKDGVTVQQALLELEHLAARIAAMAGQGPREAAFSLKPMVRDAFKPTGFHYALIGAVTSVLLIACFNLANLQLARGLSRTREFATRTAVGATRGNIISQLVQETAWLAGAGLALGAILTAWGMQVLTKSMPPMLTDYFMEPQANWRLFVFAGLAAVVCVGLVGLAPAIKLSRVDINELLKSGAGTGAQRKTRRQYGALVIAQVGLALALLVASTLLMRSAATLYRIDINPLLERTIQGYATAAPINRSDRRKMADISAELISRARAVEGVEDAATYMFRTPPHRTLTVDDNNANPQLRKQLPMREIPTGFWSYAVVSPSYLRTIGATITRGRDFTEGEFAEPLAIIDEQTALYLWPGVNPLGRMIKLGSDERRDPGWIKVVGVMKTPNFTSDIRRANQDERQAAGLRYLVVLNGADTARLDGTQPTRGRGRGISFYARAKANPHRLPMPLREALHTPASNGVSVWDTRQMVSALAVDVARQRANFVAGLFTVFALLALAVTALGVYAVVSHSVSQRTREIGVRIALGATERDIRQRVLQEGNVLALSGIAIGLILVWKSVPLLNAFLRSVDERYDSWLFGLVALVLFGVTLLASYVPARRAMRINPVEALRND